MDKQPRERLRVEEPLVADIVHRQHRAHRAEPRVPLPLKLVDGDGEGRLPVVAVQHVRRPSAREQLQHRAPEEREPVGVVRVLRSGRPIQTLAVEVPVRANEKDGRTGTGRPLEHVRSLESVRDRHVEAHPRRHDVVAAQDVPVGGQDEADVDTLAREGRGQRADHVGETAGFREGRCLGADDSDARSHDASRCAQSSGRMRPVV